MLPKLKRFDLPPKRKLAATSTGKPRLTDQSAFYAGDLPVIQLICRREGTLDLLHRAHEREAGMEEFEQLLRGYNSATAAVVRALDEWQQGQVNDTGGFEWEGTPYLLRIPTDLAFLDVDLELKKHFGISTLTHRCFAVKHTAGTADPLCSREDRPVYDAGQALVEEAEARFGPLFLDARGELKRVQAKGAKKPPAVSPAKKKPPPGVDAEPTGGLDPGTRLLRRSMTRASGSDVHASWLLSGCPSHKPWKASAKEKEGDWKADLKKMLKTFIPRGPGQLPAWRASAALESLELDVRSKDSHNSLELSLLPQLEARATAAAAAEEAAAEAEAAGGTIARSGAADDEEPALLTCQLDSCEQLHSNFHGKEHFFCSPRCRIRHHEKRRSQLLEACDSGRWVDCDWGQVEPQWVLEHGQVKAPADDAPLPCSLADEAIVASLQKARKAHRAALMAAWKQNYAKKYKVIRGMFPRESGALPPPRQAYTDMGELFAASAASCEATFSTACLVAMNSGGFSVTWSLKRAERTVLKTMEYYSRALRDFSRVLDMVRASVVFDSVEAVLKALVYLSKSEVQLRLRVVRIRNRLEKPTAYGWRDVLVNIQFEDGVVAEIQLRLRELHKVSEAAPHAHHWWGCLERAEKAGYNGPVLQQLPHGVGAQLEPSGELYRGDFERGKRHGLGVRHTYTGDRYEGRWKAGERVLGVEHRVGLGRYEGLFDDDRVHGFGVEFNPDGSRYAGAWAEGDRHGPALVFEPGGVPEGEPTRWVAGEQVDVPRGEQRFLLEECEAAAKRATDASRAAVLKSSDAREKEKAAPNHT